MTSGPTILALESGSAWAVVVAVSAVTLAAAWLVHRLLGRPSGLASVLLLGVPLLFPLLAAAVYAKGVLPEVAVLRPAGEALRDGPNGLLRLLVLRDAGGEVVMPYALAGSAGRLILLLAAAFSVLMLLRRIAGTWLVRRLTRRCEPVGDPAVLTTVTRLASRAGLAEPPPVLLLPPGISGAFVSGTRKGKILISQDLLDALEELELEGILAHEIAHVKARDLSLAFVAGLLRDVVAWNPLAHVALRVLMLDRELDADRQAAELTGRPLEVASGLVRMCELIRSSSGRSLRTGALAFLGPKGKLSRRVSNLLALSDGSDPVVSPNHLPYIGAACLVALLGLQVGARVAEERGGAFAIVLGAPEAGEIDLSTAPKWLRQGWERVRDVPRGRRVGRVASKDLELPLRHQHLLSATALKQKDFPAWLDLMKRLGAKRGLSASRLRWLAREDLQYQAVPLLPEPVGSIGVYRIDGPL